MVALRGCIGRAVIMGSTVAQGLEVKFFRVGNLNAILISTKVNLVGPLT